MKLSSEQLAVLYAAKDEIDKILKSQGDDLPVGEYNVSGQTVTITLNEGMSVEKVAGTNGDGTNSKKATQNLYGWNLVTFMARRLQCFNQWAAIRGEIEEAMRETFQSTGTLGTTLAEIDPDFAEQVAAISDEFQLPDRTEKAPRYVRREKKRQRSMVKIEA